MARGWRGDPPRDDKEARDRIIDAAMRCVARYGPSKTGLSDVATELGVTRQTVYRLFSSTDELLIAVGEAAAGNYLDRLAAHVEGLTDPTEAVIEAMAYTLERLPKEKYLGLLLTTGHSDTFVRGVTSTQAMSFGRALLARMQFDWSAWGYDEAELDGLVEFTLRQIQSLVLDPLPPRGPTKLRAFLRRWVAPAIKAVESATER